MDETIVELLRDLGRDKNTKYIESFVSDTNRKFLDITLVERLYVNHLKSDMCRVYEEMGPCPPPAQKLWIESRFPKLCANIENASPWTSVTTSWALGIDYVTKEEWEGTLDYFKAAQGYEKHDADAVKKLVIAKDVYAVLGIIVKGETFERIPIISLCSIDHSNLFTASIFLVEGMDVPTTFNLEPYLLVKSYMLNIMFFAFSLLHSNKFQRKECNLPRSERQRFAIKKGRMPVVFEQLTPL